MWDMELNSSIIRLLSIFIHVFDTTPMEKGKRKKDVTYLKNEQTLNLPQH